MRKNLLCWNFRMDFLLTATLSGTLVTDVPQKPSVSHRPGLHCTQGTRGTGGSQVPDQKAKANPKEVDVGLGSAGVRGVGRLGVRVTGLGNQTKRG